MDYNCNTDAISSMPWSCGLAQWAESSMVSMWSVDKPDG